MHAKIRLSFVELRNTALNIIKELHAYRQFKVESGRFLNIDEPTIRFETFIERGYRYFESLMFGSQKIDPEKVSSFYTTMSLARYIGVIRIAASYFGTIDILIDTTSTYRNIHFLAVVAKDPSLPYAENIATYLADECGCVCFGI